jgi:tetratricopeptide (TPR) repeat protein
MTDFLAEGIRCFQAGEMAQARRLLVQAVSTQPRSSEAWLWMGRALDEPDKKLYCFQTSLNLDPDSLEAAEAIFALEHRLAEPYTPPDPPPPPPAPSLTVQPEPVTAIAARLQSPPHPSTAPVAELSEPAPVPPTAVKPASRLAFLTGDPLLVGLAGLVLGLLLVAIPAISLVNAGTCDAWIPVRQSPEMVAELSNSLQQFTQTSLAAQAIKATSTPTPTFVNTLPAKTATPSLPERAITPGASDEPVSILLSQGRYAPAIAYLDQHIAAHPDDGAAFSLRGQAYLHLLEDAHLYTNVENRDMLTRSINNLDSAIRLGPARADDFYYRGLAYERLADDYFFYQVDRDQAHSLAIENFQAAETLGTRISDAQFDLAFALAYGGRCEEAGQVADTISRVKPAGFDYSRQADLYSAVNYCQGHLLSAIDDKKGAIDRLETCDRDTDLAFLQYNQGLSAEAMETLERSISHCPAGGGMRYYLRALLYYESGEVSLVQPDLETGASNTWFGGGTYVYLQGKLALDAGEREKGIDLIQQAEASMTFREGPALLAKARHDLEVLGAPRITAIPVLPQSTPIPPALLTPAAPTSAPLASPTATSATPSVFRPTATAAFASATPAPSPTAGPTRTPVARIPPSGSEWATDVVLDHGTGQITIKPGETKLFHFAPSTPIAVQAGTALTFRINTADVGASPLKMQIWMPGYGWQMINVTSDFIEVQMPELIVLPDGDLYVRLINKFDSPILINNASFSLTVRLTDGSIQSYGSMDRARRPMMTDPRDPKTSKALHWALTGALVGVLIAAGATALNVQARGQVLAQRQVVAAVTAAAQAQASPQAPTAVATATTAAKPVATLTALPSPSPTTAPIDPAILALETRLAGDPKADVRGELQALLGQENDPQNLARVYIDLGQLETSLGHAHLANGYYAQAYAAEKTPENLLKLAQADMAAVKFTDARVHFMELIEWPGAEADPYREEAQAGLETISQIQGVIPIN